MQCDPAQDNCCLCDDKATFLCSGRQCLRTAASAIAYLAKNITAGVQQRWNQLLCNSQEHDEVAQILNIQPQTGA